MPYLYMNEFIRFKLKEVIGHQMRDVRGKQKYEIEIRNLDKNISFSGLISLMDHHQFTGILIEFFFSVSIHSKIEEQQQWRLYLYKHT